MYQTAPRYEAYDATSWLKSELDLQDWHQDFGIENAQPERTIEFCEFYQTRDLAVPVRFALMVLIVASWEEMDINEISKQVEKRIADLLKQDYDIHYHTVEYWAFDEFHISPFMLSLWQECTPDLLKAVGTNDFGRIISAHKAGEIMDAALLRAADKGYTDCIEPLLQSGADCDARDYYRCTPLMLTMDADGVKVLLAAGANPNAINSFGDTALIRHAMNQERPTTIELLIANRANLELADSNGYTALHSATEHGRERIVEKLLMAGADATKRTLNGETPLDIASRHKYAAIMNLIRGCQ